MAYMDYWYTKWTTRISPSEYDWKNQFKEVIKVANKSGNMYQIIDIGKVAGLCKYIEELEEKLIK